MCGITGIWHLNKEVLAEKKLSIFNDSLAHRGPNNSSIYIDKENNLGLGHRRLSVIDLSNRGSQPMSYENERYWIVFNGEIYNFIELRDELSKIGYKFKSDTDTEVILAAFSKWGSECLHKFNGMWAFAIWDKEKKELFMSRDRFGIKPLYFIFIKNKLFAFASETIAFKDLEGFDRNIDPKLLSKNLKNPFSLEGYGYTIYKDIFQILPGHYSIFKVTDEKVKQKRWWSTLLNLTRDIPDKYEERVNKFRAIFEDSCRLRMRSDVAIATALSGGLDSSSVYCTVNKLMNNSQIERSPKNWQQAFVGVFKDTSLDEKKYADEVVNHVNGTAVYIEQDFSKIENEIISTTSLFDSIHVSPISAASNIYRAMRENGITVSLDGHGVDEMLFGYRSLVSETKASWFKKFKYITKEILGINNELKYLGEKEDLSKLNYLDKVIYKTFHYTTLPTILRNFDRASMQHGIEVRMPFMDYRLVTFVFSLPLEDKIDDNFNKKILRDSMRNTIPENIRTRKLKIGLNAPMIEWFSGPLKNFISKIISSEHFDTIAGKDSQKLIKMVKLNSESGSWAWSECATLWPYINAVILLENQKLKK